jgi:iron complex outermembrane receptor protein
MDSAIKIINMRILTVYGSLILLKPGAGCVVAKRFFYVLLLSLGLVYLSGPVFAETGLTEEDFLGEIPMVMSATRMPQSVTDTPVAMTVIDRKMIEASGFVEIPDLFRLVPGFQVGLSWRDHHSAVTYHGQSDGLSRRMQVLIDGRVAVGSLFGIVDWDRLGIVVDDIARIEVVRGSAGVAYGSNAFVGVINIITREPLDDPGWRMTATSGSENTTIVSTQYAHVGEWFDYIASASYLDTDGFDDVNDESTARSGRFKGHYQYAPNTFVDFQFGYSDGPWGRGGTGLSIDPVTTKDVTEQYGNLRLTQSESPGNEWYLQIGINSVEERDKYDVGLLSDVLGVSPADIPVIVPGQEDQNIVGSAFDYTSNRFDIEFQKMSLWANQHRALWGIGYRKDTVKGLSVIKTNDRESMDTFRAYGNIEYRLSDRVLMNVGLSYEDNNFVRGRYSSRFGFNVNLAKNHVLKLAVAESWRQPYLAEHLHDVSIRLNDGSVLEQVQLSEGKLKPERMRSYEAGYVGYWLNKTLLTEVKVFREELRRELEFVADPFYPEVVSLFNPGTILDKNGGATDIVGIEGSLNWQFTRNTRLWAAYSFAEVDQHCQPFSVRCTHESDATPRHTGSLLISHKFSHAWETSIGYYYLDEMAWTLWGADRDSYDRVDLRVAKSFNLNSSRLTLELIGQNLGGDYHEFNQANVFETRTFVRATLQF